MLMVASIPTSVVMARTVDDGVRLAHYQAHLLLGWTVVALAIWRVGVRVRQRVSAPPGLAAWNRRRVHAVHWVVAVCPVLPAGEAPPAALDVTTARTGHQVGAYLFTAPLVIDVAGIVRHQARFGRALAPMLRTGR